MNQREGLTGGEVFVIVVAGAMGALLVLVFVLLMIAISQASAEVVRACDVETCVIGDPWMEGMRPVAWLPWVVR